MQLSSQMLSAGRDDDWERVAALESQRRSLLLGDLPSKQSETPPAVVELLRKIIAVNDSLTTLATAAKEASAEELSRAQLGRRVVSAYQAVSK